MYLPAQFNETRTDVMRALMRTHPLSTLVIQSDSGLVADHVPVQTLDEPRPLGCIWKIDDAPAPYIDKMLSLIVGFEFSIAALRGKWKVSQNRPQADRAGVIGNLRNAGDADSHEIAEMLAALDPEPEAPRVR